MRVEPGCELVCAVVVTLEPLPAAETYVNGKQISEAVVLKQGPDVCADVKRVSALPVASSSSNMASTLQATAS